MDLLAPAGNIVNFHAAIAAGADAVYVGVPGINARNLSRDLRLEEIGAMIVSAHGMGKKVYLAANSLILEEELSAVVETLALLESLEPDALIVQDLAIVHLVRQYFPNLRLHASTLMSAHNSDAVELFSAMGCERVVLARELTLKEIAKIVKGTEAEVEVFVHGAMCYSYSGLCLFSSYLGGKSSMRGRCVQPCRRNYTWQGRSGKKRHNRPKNLSGGYLFSMNDLEGFEAVPQLLEAGVTSLKIEGRLRSANYVSKIVEAYRLVLDAPPTQREDAVEQARELAEEAMGRKTTPGYFFSPQPQQAIIPYHSGNMGIHLGHFSSLRKEEKNIFGRIRLKKSVRVGDRLRLHVEATGERKGFTLQKLSSEQGAVDYCRAGTVVKIGLPGGEEATRRGKIELYKVDSRSSGAQNPISDQEIKKVKNYLNKVRKDKKKRIQYLQRKNSCSIEMSDLSFSYKRPVNRLNKRGNLKGSKMELWLKTDSDKSILHRLPFSPDMFLLQIDKRMVSQSALIKKHLGKNSRKVTWALPPVVLENELGRLRKQIQLLLRSGFKSFQVAHLSQIALFGNERVHLCSDYTLNLANSQALLFASQTGVEAAQLSIEMDRPTLALLVRSYRETQRRQKEDYKSQREEATPKKVKLGLTIYGAPPLFTSRLAAPHLQFNKTLLSPKDEQFTLLKKEGIITTLPKRPFSLLPYLAELEQIGLDYVVVDISRMNYGEKDLKELGERIAGLGKFSKLPTFNYLGKLE